MARHGVPGRSGPARPATSAALKDSLRVAQVTYAGHYANAAGNLNSAPEINDDGSGGETKENGGGFRRYSWAELLALVWRVDPLECPKCGEQMERGRTMRGEELREFLKSINRLGYPPRPPPVPLAGRDWPQESSEDPFIEPDSSQFTDDTNRFPRTGTPSDAFALNGTRSPDISAFSWSPRAAKHPVSPKHISVQLSILY